MSESAVSNKINDILAAQQKHFVQAALSKAIADGCTARELLDFLSQKRLEAFLDEITVESQPANDDVKSAALPRKSNGKAKRGRPSRIDGDDREAIKKDIHKMVAKQSMITTSEIVENLQEVHTSLPDYTIRSILKEMCESKILKPVKKANKKAVHYKAL